MTAINLYSRKTTTITTTKTNKNKNKTNNSLSHHIVFHIRTVSDLKVKTKTSALFHNQGQIQRGVSHLNGKILTFMEGQIKTLTHGRVVQLLQLPDKVKVPIIQFLLSFT